MRRTLLSLLCLAGWAGLSASAQPLAVSPEIQVNTYTPGLQALGGIASDAAGHVVVAWESGLPPSPLPQDGSGSGIFVRRFDRSGAPLTGEIQVNVFTAGSQRAPGVDMTPAGDFVVTWWSEGQDGPSDYRPTAYARLFAADGTPKTGEIRLGTSAVSGEYFPTPSFCPDGGFVAIWQQYQEGGSDILARWFDPAGAPRGEAIVANSRDFPENGYPDVECDLQGRAIVAWEACCDLYGGQADIRLRIFGPDGDPLSREIQADVQPGRTFQPSVAVAPDGSFAVVWDYYRQVWARRFKRDGLPATAPWRVSQPGASEGDAEALLDGAGNLLVTWSGQMRETGDYEVYGAWYDRSGAAKGGLFRLNATTALDQGGARIALQPGGFMAAWTSGKYGGGGQDGDQWGVFARRFVIPPAGADPCVQDSDGLACDLLHDGGSAEIRTAFARPGEAPLLGNLDGDSRDDLCVYRNGSFRCDTAHDGGAAELEIDFGEAGNLPVLGNINGI